jgi:hypothetical protein
VVTFWVDKEGKTWIEVAVRFTDGADVCCGVAAVAEGIWAARHCDVEGRGRQRELRTFLHEALSSSM